VKINWNDVVSDEDIVLRLRKIIKDSGLQQKKLATLMKTPYSQTCALITGRKTLRGEHIISFCRALKITPNDLLGFVEEDKMQELYTGAS